MQRLRKITIIMTSWTSTESSGTMFFPRCLTDFCSWNCFPIFIKICKGELKCQLLDQRTPAKKYRVLSNNLFKRILCLQKICLINCFFSVHVELIYNLGKKRWRRLYNLTSVHFKVHKRWFSLLLKTMALFWPIENWDIPEQLRAQTLWFCSLLLKGAAGDGEKEKKEKGKKKWPS